MKIGVALGNYRLLTDIYHFLFLNMLLVGRANATAGMMSKMVKNFILKGRNTIECEDRSALTMAVCVYTAEKDGDDVSKSVSQRDEKNLSLSART